MGESAVAMRTLVFIPAWNEEASVAAVIAGVRERLPDADVLVVDDGSIDATADTARAAGAVVASLPFNQGLGAALQTGYLYALRQGYDFCAHLDADGQHPPPEVARLLEEVRADHADLVIGSRYRDPGQAESDDYQPTISRRIGTSVFRFFLTLATRQRFTDTTSGMRAANRRVMELFSENYSPDFAEIESLQLAVRQGLRVEEVPVRMLERAGGTSFLTPLRSAFFIFKGLIVLLVGQFRPRRGGGGAVRRSAQAASCAGEQRGALLAESSDHPAVHLTAQTRILAAIIAIAFMVMILELIRRDRLQERYSVVWFVAGLAMLLGAAFPGLLTLVADVMGVRDTNVALFSIVLLMLLGLALNFSVIMSRQAAQITRLAQERALEKAREQAATENGGSAQAGTEGPPAPAPRRR